MRICLLLGTALTGTIMGASGSAAPVPSAVVILHLDNLSHISRTNLEDAEKILTRIYADAGVTTVWSNGGAESTAADAAGDVHVAIRLVAGAQEKRMLAAANEGGDALAFALRDDGRGGQMAFVLAERLSNSALEHSYPVEWLLGYVMAHELGHLLLPMNSHAPSGIMQPIIRPRMGVPPRFTAAQAALIRQRLAERPWNDRASAPDVVRHDEGAKPRLLVGIGDYAHARRGPRCW